MSGRKKMIWTLAYRRYSSLILSVVTPGFPWGFEVLGKHFETTEVHVVWQQHGHTLGKQWCHRH